ncbi:hypothetical protein NEOLI_001354 [Neolecta irregularis DAH-3]|uniref:Uncharacterized protein n=1 Tax=Neolecta irregularis (strain DAH-3) TaxID=1198029 RepID=A0A1U7LV50_NEOID|nr:hypothetical protein NEOLI_001354 [Neolecta irregularis DAH-3]|eukprot:OLL26537.1 hypothetical protein NEOLI_001354 [Neolecta irregularis DAH-3]
MQLYSFVLTVVSVAYAIRSIYHPNRIDMELPPTRSLSWWRPIELPLDTDIADKETIIASRDFEFKIAMPYIEVEDWTSQYLGNMGIACTEFCEKHKALGARLAPKYSSSWLTTRNAVKCDCFAERIESLLLTEFTPILPEASSQAWNDLDFETVTRMGHGYYARRIHPYSGLKSVDRVFQELTTGEEIDQLSAQSIYPQWSPLDALSHLQSLQKALQYVKKQDITEEPLLAWLLKLKTAIKLNCLSHDLIQEFQRSLVFALDLEAKSSTNIDVPAVVVLFKDTKGRFRKACPSVSHLLRSQVITSLIPLTIETTDILHWVVMSYSKSLQPAIGSENERVFVQEIVSTCGIPPNIENDMHEKIGYQFSINRMDFYRPMEFRSHSFKDANTSDEAAVIAVDTWIRMIFQTPLATFGPYDRSNIEMYGYSAPYEFTFKLVIWTLCLRFNIDPMVLFENLLPLHVEKTFERIVSEYFDTTGTKQTFVSRP